jgi:hypothetical protein
MKLRIFNRFLLLLTFVLGSALLLIDDHNPAAPLKQMSVPFLTFGLNLWQFIFIGVAIVIPLLLILNEFVVRKPEEIEAGK